VLVGVSPESSASVERAGRTGLGLHPIITDWESFEKQLAASARRLPPDVRPGRSWSGSTAPSPKTL